jgi:hypothetical protein
VIISPPGVRGWALRRWKAVYEEDRSCGGRIVRPRERGGWLIAVGRPPRVELAASVRRSFAGGLATSTSSVTVLALARTSPFAVELERARAGG